MIEHRIKSERPPVIILAGGESKRFGSPKGLISFENKFWIDHQIQTLLDMNFSRCVVILGAQAEMYQATSSFLKHQNAKITSLVNPDFSKGPFSSLQVGIEFLIGLKQSSGTFVLPIDVPVPSIETFEAIVNVKRNNVKAITPSFFGQGGHPIWISSSFMNHLLQVPLNAPEARLDLQIKALNSEELIRIAVNDSKILLNLNYRKDFKDIPDTANRFEEGGIVYLQ